MQNRTAVLLIAVLATVPSVARAQILRDPGAVAAPAADPSSPVSVMSVKGSGQQLFEIMHLDSLPNAHSGRPAQCDEQVGNVCWLVHDRRGTDRRRSNRSPSSASATS